ncbi:pseudouridine synthase [Paracoccus caeni]|uniref:Pseudouridine synthase n=1 Tax=Paracoccus caeni TaxID=657651 RepID=A0A934SBK3_9RHOB|nr:pseudouridine synthase [Paracoccus caeni]MBK4215796.1 pseudouridine synthase [Paracoccus caeni]
MTEDNTPTPNPEPEKAERIAKMMARAGVASRREAERMIVEGRVTVNGERISSPALDVLSTDRIAIDGKRMDAPQETRLWLYYKPIGLVTSEADERGRQTVFDALPRDLPRVMTIGRLDLNSEGLLLLTNDGELKRRLELPSTGWLRRYRVRVNGTPNDLTFAPLRRGVTIDGEEFAPMEIKLDSQQGANAWLTVGIREGKNREIRRTMAHVGLQVNRLIRIGYGPFKLVGLEKNQVSEVKRRVLRDQLGGLLTGEAIEKEREMRPRGADRGADRAEGGPRKPFRSGDAEGAPRRSFRADGPKPAGGAPRFAGRGESRDGDAERPRRFGAKPAGGERGESRSGKPGPRDGSARDGGSRDWNSRERHPREAAEGAREGGYRDRPASSRRDGDGGKPGARSGSGKPGFGKPSGRPGQSGPRDGAAREGGPRGWNGGERRPREAAEGGREGDYRDRPAFSRREDDAGKPGGRSGAGKPAFGKPKGRPGQSGSRDGFAGKPGRSSSESKPFRNPKAEGKPGLSDRGRGKPSGGPGGRPSGKPGGRSGGKPRG